jgi:hypothetical protein
MDSAPYRFYMRWLYPLERAICGPWPGLLAFQFVILAKPNPTARLLSEPLSDQSAAEVGV